MGRPVENTKMVSRDAIMELNNSLFTKKFFQHKSEIPQGTFNNLLRGTNGTDSNVHMIHALVDEYIIQPRAVLRKIRDAAFTPGTTEITLSATEMSHLLPLAGELDWESHGPQA